MMEWVNYKAICDRPNVFSRWALTQTVEAVNHETAKRLKQRIPQQAIEKPRDHKGDERTDMFDLELDQELIEAIVFDLREREGRYQPLLNSWAENLVKG